MLGQPCKANKERQRSLEEMQSASGIVLDGTVTNVLAKQKSTPPNAQGDALVPDDYEATVKVDRIHKGQIRDQSVILVYSRISDPRFKGDNPPALKAGDRFRLFADKMESNGPPIVIRVRTANAVRPEAVEANSNSSSLTTPPKPPGDAVPQSAPFTPGKPTDPKPRAPDRINEPASSKPWSIIVGLILAALALLWWVLKRRS
jgi:hypothetical protein